MHKGPDRTPGSVSLFPFGERWLLLHFGGQPVETAHRTLISLYRHLHREPFPGFTEAVPAYDSLAIGYDPQQVEDIESQVRALLAENRDTEPEPGPLHEIPVHYGGAEGPDLSRVAKENGLNERELVQLHTGREYEVYLLGFTAGFPYLGFTHPRLATARKERPEPRVPAGSVALAGNQTGIYPREGPGAWQLIGRTERLIFDPDAQQPALFQPGDRVRFVEA